MMIWRRGQRSGDGEKLANANDDFTDLSPVSLIPAAQVFSAWAAVLPNQTIPLIWERRYDDE